MAPSAAHFNFSPPDLTVSEKISPGRGPSLPALALFLIEKLIVKVQIATMKNIIDATIIIVILRRVSSGLDLARSSVSKKFTPLENLTGLCDD